MKKKKQKAVKRTFMKEPVSQRAWFKIFMVAFKALAQFGLQWACIKWLGSPEAIKVASAAPWVSIGMNVWTELKKAIGTKNSGSGDEE